MIPIADFHRLPGTTPQMDTNLQRDELILSIDLPQSPYAEHSHYLKVRDRASYDFALVSVAAALEMQSGSIKSARLALGGVAHKPWRSEKAEALLAGKQPNTAAFEAAATEALNGAQPLNQNAYKVELAKRAIVRALTLAGGAA
jgi:xanthine dehydrogenase YagS FAD-binding subunit